MRNIILGYELYDSRTKEGRNLNGRVEPSTVNIVDSTLIGINEQYYQWFIRPDIYGCFFNGYLGEHISDLFIKRIQVSCIEEGIYFYPIEILSLSSYVDLTSHIAISENVKTDVLNKKAFILFRYVFEGNMFNPWHLERFNKLVTDLVLPKEQILVFHGDQNTGNYKDCNFTYIPTNVFPFWLQNYKKDSLVSYRPNKLFLCYNRIIRPHRILMLGLLKRASILEQGLVSLGMCNHIQLSKINRALNEILTTEEIQFISTLSGTSPDNRPLTLDDNPACNIVKEHYEDTFVSLVNETLTETVFFSEKIFKPILMGHPFILIGGKGSLKKLKEMGFKTFDKWWDESYDDCDCFIERCIKVTEVLSKLSEKNNAQLQLMRSFMRPILKHNQDLYTDMIRPSPLGMDKEIIEYLRKLV
jgi:hypothetical protein